jgi:cellulose synthase/poly-beta-1,6-N-acetylglucosamine synthase-like glycosyltransferase
LPELKVLNFVAKVPVCLKITSTERRQPACWRDQRQALPLFQDVTLTDASWTKGMPEKQQPAFDFTTIALLVSVTFYFVSWFLPALEFKGIKGTTELKVMEGWECTYMGLLGLAIGQFEAFSNLALICSGILLLERMWKAAFIASGLALVLALQTFALFITPISFDEAHATQSVLSGLDVGFYLWISSIVIVFIASLAKIIQAKIAQYNEEQPVE